MKMLNKITETIEQNNSRFEKSHAAAIDSTVKLQSIMEETASDTIRERLYEATAELIANMGLDAIHKSRWQNQLLQSYQATCENFRQLHLVQAPIPSVVSAAFQGYKETHYSYENLTSI